MKMIVAIIKDDDSDKVLQALINADLRVTRIASTGGFFRKGSTTLMIGLMDERVQEAIDIIRDNCDPSIEPGVKRATLFVLDVAHYEQI
jgi:uncharacterized protein YaaQ